MATENKHLESKIKEALENLTPEYNPQSWDLLEQRLAAEDILNPTEAENSIVDGLVTQSLAHLSVGTNADWSLFEEKLEASELSELEEIDQLAIENLSQYEAPYQSSHWSLMLKRIEEEFTLRGKLYKYKVAEIALMLLLIFTVINLQPLDYFPIKFGQKKQNIKSEINAQNSDTQPLENQNLIPQNNEEQKDLTEKAAVPIADNSVQKSASDKIYSNNNSKINSSQITDNQIVIDDMIERRSMIDAPSQLPNNFNSVESQSKNTLANNLGSKDENRTVPMIGSLMALEISVLNEDDPDFELPEPKIEKIKPLWRIGTFSAIDANHVYTPADRTFPSPAYTSIAGGYGGGISIGMKLRRWVFESGGQYSFKRYIPQPVGNEPFKPSKLFTEDFKGVQLDLLQIPLNIQYHFIGRGKWRMYLNAGASVHMILSPVYELERNWLAAPIPFEGECDTCLPNVKEFPEGILEGGSFKENSYGTANVGLGLERYFNPRWSIFMQPTYQHYITKQGVGPNDDKIYSVSFLLGTKVSLK